MSQLAFILSACLLLGAAGSGIQPGAALTHRVCLTKLALLKLEQVCEELSENCFNSAIERGL
jgi:hypothetical protein